VKHSKGGKEMKMDLLVMENLLYARHITRLYDLKGSARSRYNSDSSGSNKVLLDQNLLEAMPMAPIFVGNKAKRLLERAVWNDTAFLAVSSFLSIKTAASYFTLMNLQSMFSVCSLTVCHQWATHIAFQLLVC
jgi:hypothetical protein